MIIGTGPQLRSIVISSVAAAGWVLPVSGELKSLGVILDGRLSFSNHVQSIVRACNFHLQALTHVRHLLSDDAASSIGCRIVASRLDYCSSLLYGAPETVLCELQRVLNNLARVVLKTSSYWDSIDLFCSLHWLFVRQRIHYRICTWPLSSVFISLLNIYPSCCSRTLPPALQGRRRRCCYQCPAAGLILAREPSGWPRLFFVTTCRQTLDWRSQCKVLRNVQRHTCSGPLSPDSVRRTPLYFKDALQICYA